MQDAEVPGPEHRWEPLGLEQVKQLFAQVSAPWWIAGGRALDMFIVEGIHTSIPLQQRILADPDFQAGNFDTNFIKRYMK